MKKVSRGIKMKKTKKFKTNTLYHYANEYRKNLTDESDIELIDMTAVLEAEEEEMIKNGEIILENINAKMRLGKSTMAMARAVRIFGLLQKYKKQPKSAKFNMANIARDDQEFSKMMRKPDLCNTVIVTDESNELEGTGENVTVEQALKKVFSDVQAGRYVHRISCSPKETIDPNTDIMLSVVAIDKATAMTRSKLYYRFYEGGQEYTQLLGFVDTYVGDIIKNWNLVKETFVNPDKTDKEKALIVKLRKIDWYVEYMIKKYEKMELITTEGIFKPRMLDYAEIILQVADKLKPLCRLSSVVNHNIVRNYIKMSFRQAKIPTSLVGEELATREVMGLLDIWKAYWKITRDVVKIDNALQNPRTKIVDVEAEKEKATQMVELRDTLLQTAMMQEDELHHYMAINKKYHERIL
jgi:hypothetical protein